ncbi:c-type cytochrome [Fibrella sp. HMF5335]|uniref:C-type cytochrome n=1 Tax=Fibrella rubiginis TaxID=2817060 RepID=A0A939GP59_9BACT|nr:c-type cytochrome [Fibrella rubiginis]MBO0940067.1 c-type cytochrome [Fibrella rubiginis]
MVKSAYKVCLLSVLLSVSTGLQHSSDEGPSPARTPDQEQATFQLEPGLSIQLVAAEPLVQDPVAMTFDADGRLWVVEMRGFMPTIDGEGENKPVGRISVLEDTNADGRMDKSTVYLDSLIMPRALALVPGGALVAENSALWLTQDKNGDLKADRNGGSSKTLIDNDYAGSALPEHAGNGLWRSMDNHYYNAKSRFRYQLVNGQWQRDSTEFRGQWGLSHDNKGRLYYNYNWSQLHADLVPPNYLNRNKHHTATTGIDQGLTIDRRVYPVRPNPAVNRGYIPGTLDKGGRLQEFTAACSPFVYRGTALPTAYAGNVFVCEPAGNLIKRNVLTENGPLITARDPHPGREFLASTDERFRPVSMAEGPDGALYIADIYRGLIQHSAYITPYLKEQTLARKLVQPTDRGRIWRIVPQGWKAPKRPKLSAASSAELVGYLSSPDGWYRDMAQGLLIDRDDKSVGPALTALAQKGKDPLARFHALWTLNGLHLNQPDQLLRLAADPDALVQATAIRLLEPFAQGGQAVRTSLGQVLTKQAANATAAQALQLALTAQVLDANVAQPLLMGIARQFGTIPLIRDAVMSSLQDGEFALLQRILAAPDWQTQTPANEIFVEMLTTAIVRKHAPTELTALLTRLDTQTGALTWQQKAVVAGLATGASAGKFAPVSLAAAPRVLSPAGGVEPSRRAAVASLFTWPGHAADQQEMAKANPLGDDDQKLFAAGRQLYLSTCSGCHGTDGRGMARFAPPLIGSDWVLGDGKRLALILLHGMEGPVDVAGKVYNTPDILPVMPAHSTMDDASITAILTYIRNEWGNQAGPIGKRVVGTTRVTSQGRVMPWTANELNKYVK